jgi:hypothetical protein
MCVRKRLTQTPFKEASQNPHFMQGAGKYSVVSLIKVATDSIQ